MPSAANHRCLVPVRDQGSELPIFVTHGMQCDPTFAQLLARFIRPERPIFGFKGLGLSGDFQPHSTIEQMAAAYLRERSVWPAGPYILAVFCAGGHIALEMAHRLAAAEKRILIVFLIDTPATADPEVLSSAISTQVRIAEDRFNRHSESQNMFVGAPRTVEAFGEALRSYIPKRFDGIVHIYANEQRQARMLHPELGWRGLLPQSTRIITIAPNHDAIAKHRMPLVARLTSRWQPYVRR